MRASEARRWTVRNPAPAASAGMLSGSGPAGASFGACSGNDMTDAAKNPAAGATPDQVRLPPGLADGRTKSALSARLPGPQATADPPPPFAAPDRPEELAPPAPPADMADEIGNASRLLQRVLERIPQAETTIAKHIDELLAEIPAAVERRLTVQPRRNAPPEAFPNLLERRRPPRPKPISPNSSRRAPADSKQRRTSSRPAPRKPRRRSKRPPLPKTSGKRSLRPPKPRLRTSFHPSRKPSLPDKPAPPQVSRPLRPNWRSRSAPAPPTFSAGSRSTGFGVGG